VPDLRDGLIVAKVGIARKRDPHFPKSELPSPLLSRKERGEDGAPGVEDATTLPKAEVKARAATPELPSSVPP